MNVEETLADRGKRYGDYLSQCEISCAIRDIIAIHERRTGVILDADMRDAIDMIAVKLSRIINGDPRYADNWHDIAGYATLVANRLEKEQKQ